MPDVPPDRPVRAAGHLPPARGRGRPVRHLPEERALRTEGHDALSPAGVGLAADVPVPQPAGGDEGPVLRPRLQSLHRLRALHAGVRRTSRRRCDRHDRARGAGARRHGHGRLPAGVRLRVLRRVHRRLPGRRAHRDLLQVGTAGARRAVGMRRVSRRLHDDLRGQPLGAGRARGAGAELPGEHGAGVLPGQVRVRVRQRQAPHQETARAAGRRTAGGHLGRGGRRRGRGPRAAQGLDVRADGEPAQHERGALRRAEVRARRHGLEQR